MANFLAFNIEQETNRNKYYRRVLYTSPDMQLVLMCIAPNQEIEREKHDVSQFFRVESGTLRLIIDETDFNDQGKPNIILIKEFDISKDHCFIIPPGTYHHIKNLTSEDVHLYTIYGKNMHPPYLLSQYSPSD